MNGNQPLQRWFTELRDIIHKNSQEVLCISSFVFFVSSKHLPSMRWACFPVVLLLILVIVNEAVQA